jgi:drug/metabolite transporter (DMT)-like permease
MTTAAPTRPRLSATLGMVLVTLCWGGNFTATKIAFVDLGPLAFTALRFGIASLVLMLVVQRVEGSIRPPPRSFWRLVALGVTGNTAYQICFVEGLARTSATKSALILAVLPVAVTLSAAALGIETVSRRQKVAVGVATLGVGLVLLARGGSIGGPFGFGDTLLLLGVVAWTGYTLLLKRWSPPMSALALTAWTVVTGTPGLLLAGLPQLSHTDWAAVSLAGWGGLGYSTLLSLVVAYIFWNRGVIELGASRAATYNTVVPFVATVIAIVALGERPGPLHLLGGLLIVCGVLLTIQRPATELI